MRMREGGMVTAELAVSLLAVIAVLAAVMSMARVLVVQLRCIDAAYTAARLAARGDVNAESIGKRAAPSGADVVIVRRGDTVTVTVSRHVRVAGVAFTQTVHGTATAVLEPGEVT